jgi:hypothetical protein
MEMENEKNEIIVGGVYQTSLSINPIRVIAFDKVQVFYDVWWGHLNDWGNKNSLKSKVYYYRTLPNTILNNSFFLRVEPLTDAEMKVHRPDLPFSICRNERLSWTNKQYSTVGDYEKHIINTIGSKHSFDNLDIAEVVLVPFGLKGAHKKGVLIRARNGKDFSCTELLWHAHNAQSGYTNCEIEVGVGLHRLGFEKGVPSFYIWGYFDKGGLLNP